MAIITLFIKILVTVSSVDNTVGEIQHLLDNPNALVTISKGMQAVKLCTNNILQLLTGGTG